MKGFRAAIADLEATCGTEPHLRKQTTDANIYARWISPQSCMKTRNSIYRIAPDILPPSFDRLHSPDWHGLVHLGASKIECRHKIPRKKSQAVTIDYSSKQ
jgi:hypothetical protein